jgi:integrase
VSRQDVQQWIAWLLGRYSAAYASNQYRALQQFFKWLAVEEEIPDPMAAMRPPHVPDKPVPVFTGEDLARLERSCAGRSFAQRRDAAVIAVLRATGIRLSELAAIRYHPGAPPGNPHIDRKPRHRAAATPASYGPAPPSQILTPARPPPARRLNPRAWSA